AQYLITLTVYRDCNGINLSQSNMVARCSSTTLNITNQTKVSVRDITKVPNSCGVVSRCAGGASQYGTEEHVWTMTLDLSTYSCCEWQLSWEQCCRNGAITTGAANQNMYITAMLNKCVTACNNSPEFNSKVGEQVLVCHNWDQTLDFSATDSADNDSLSYHLVSAKTGLNSSVTYNGNFTFERPMTFFGFPNQNLQWPAGFRLDPATGILRFRPTQVNQIGIIAVEVREWRLVNGSMMQIGSIVVDLQVRVIPCPNNNQAPRIKSPISARVCAGNKICIPIQTEDDNLNDTVRISWNQLLPGATFTHNNGVKRLASGEVCWTPDTSFIRQAGHAFKV
ncbi:MAG: hypothetical protein LPK45_02110, partial [Bacteroidota bacterium]|nr:hypothetical protein [Bacteroidota bacterium]MDX5429828.1 hypothetical protein [Bacteroidota bacterium]MDX5468607.1 hypothetical protein [Bacteroidota bacterium]